MLSALPTRLYVKLSTPCAVIVCNHASQLSLTNLCAALVVCM